MSSDNDRPQDVGRSHTRKRSTADAALIERWQTELRAVLDRCIRELQGADQGVGLDGEPIPRKLPSIAVATDIVKLGTLASKELGGAIDPRTPGAVVGAERAKPGPRRASY